MNIELRCRGLDHPRRNPSERAVCKDNSGDRLTAMGYAPPKRDRRPVMRMEAVVDLNFIVLIVGTMCPIRLD
jgi:hypothetical protein